MLMMLAPCVLLASLNVATLLLSRSDARRARSPRGWRSAPAAWRIVRQLLTETAVLAAAGGALGLLVRVVGRSDAARGGACATADRRRSNSRPMRASLALHVAMCVIDVCLVFGLAARAARDRDGAHWLPSARRRRTAAALARAHARRVADGALARAAGLRGAVRAQPATISGRRIPDTRGRTS